MKLGKAVEISLGKNISRIDDNPTETLDIYTTDDLENDLSAATAQLLKADSTVQNSNKFIVSSGEIVYNLTSSTVGIVSQMNAGKLINQNFAKLVVKNDMIDAKYLCFLLNQSDSVRRQKYILMQGTVTPKITPAIIRQLEFSLPPMKKQILIGKLYFDMNRYQYLIDKRSNILRMLNLDILNKSNYDPQE